MRKNNNFKRIGIVTTPLDRGQLSAPASCQLELIKALRAIDSQEIEIFLIHFKKGFNSEVYNGFNEVICKKGILATNKCIKNLRLDVVHMNNLTYKWLGFYFLKTRKVVTIHGDASFVLPRTYFSGRVIVEEYIIRLMNLLGLLQLIQKYIVVSESLKNNLIKHLRIPAEKIDVVYNGLGEDISFQKNASEIVRKKWGIKSPYLLNVNNYARKKNLETVLESFGMYRKSGGSLKLVLVGSGVRAALSEKIKLMGLDKSVMIIDHVQHADLSYIYSGATLLVNPTLHETFGLPNIEAMACHCPVLTSTRYSVPEVAGGAARTVTDPTDSTALCARIVELLEDKNELNRMRREGLLQANKFTWEKSAWKIINIYTNHN